MPIYRRCVSCGQLYTGKRCPACKKKQDKRYRENKKAKDDLARIYHLRLWEKCRRNILMKYLGYDIWLLAEGQIIKPDKIIVHHIQEREESPELIFDIDNLITVSVESHNDIHHYYKTDKQYALDRIQRGKDKFNELFGE